LIRVDFSIHVYFYERWGFPAHDVLLLLNKRHAK
jgi:hypothetical protein